MNIAGLRTLPVLQVNPAIGAAVAQDLAGLLTGSDSFQQNCARIGDRFNLNPFAVAMFFANVGQILPVLRPEPEEVRYGVLGGFLEATRGHTSALGQVGSFLVGDDWRRRPYRTRQTLFEALDIAAMGAAIYRSLRTELPDQPVFNILNVVSPQVSIARLALPGTEGSLELRTGSSESHGGLEFRLVLGQDELVAKVGVQLGSDAVSVVQIQGGGKRFSVQRDLLRPVLGNLHPFDWILMNLERWAFSAGFRRLRGCGYRLNSSLIKHFEAGDFPEARRESFRKLYDDRFLALGMKPHPELPDVYEIDLRVARFSEKEDSLKSLMNCIDFRNDKSDGNF